jgi:hypothetical protein
MTRVVLPPRRPESGGLMAEVDDRALGVPLPTGTGDHERSTRVRRDRP